MHSAPPLSLPSLPPLPPLSLFHLHSHMASLCRLRCSKYMRNGKMRARAPVGPITATNLARAHNIGTLSTNYEMKNQWANARTRQRSRGTHGAHKHSECSLQYFVWHLRDVYDLIGKFKAIDHKCGWSFHRFREPISMRPSMPMFNAFSIRLTN